MSRARLGLAWTLKLLLAGLLLWAGFAKLAAPADFAQEIAGYRILSELSPLLAATLPGVEVVLGLALLAPPRLAVARAAVLLTLALMLVFTAALTSVMLRGIDIDCGCFGSGTGPVTWLTVLRDLGISVAAAGALLLPPREAQLSLRI